MKVYAVPDAVPAPVVDYKNFDFAKMEADEAAHQAQHLRESGHTGKHTGGIVRFGDAYQYRGIEHFPKKEIVAQIEMEKRHEALFRK